MTNHSGLLFATAEVVGPAGLVQAELALDTGAVATTLTPAVIRRLGYSRRDGYQSASVRTPVGVEYGYVIRIEKFTALGVTAHDFPIHVFPLGHDIDGLIGMNYLRYFNFEVRPLELVILAEPIP